MNKNLEKVLDVFVMVFLGCLVVALSYIYQKPKHVDSPMEIRCDTVFSERVDTLRIVKEITKTRPLPTQTDTIYRTDTIKETNEVVQHIAEVTNVYEGSDSSIVDSLLPPTRVDYHWYVRNKNYDLDSISITFDVQAPIITREVEITKEITRTKTKRWGFTAGGGVGYNGKIEPFVGFIWGYRF